MPGFLGDLLKEGAKIAAAVVDKGIEELERAEQRRREFEQKAAKTVEKVVDKAVARKEEFDRNAEKKLGDFINVLGELLGAPAQEEPAAVEPAPAKLNKPVLKAPTTTVEPKPAVVAPEPAAVTPKKRGGGKKRPSGKNMTR